MEIISVVLGIIVGFVLCLLLWFWIENKNAEDEDEPKN